MVGLPIYGLFLIVLIIFFLYNRLDLNWDLVSLSTFPSPRRLLNF